MNVEELQLKAAGLKASIRKLTSERQQLAPYAVNGDARGPQARLRIKQIDVERAAQVSDLETIEDAIRSPEGKQASELQRLDDGFQRQLGKPKVSPLGYFTGALYGRLHSLAERPHNVPAKADKTYFEVVALECAKEASGETAAEQEHNYAKENPNNFHRADRATETAEQILNRTAAVLELRKRHTDQLLAASTVLLPSSRDELVSMYGHGRGLPQQHNGNLGTTVVPGQPGPSRHGVSMDARMAAAAANADARRELGLAERSSRRRER